MWLADEEYQKEEELLAFGKVGPVKLLKKNTDFAKFGERQECSDDVIVEVENSVCYT
ncbi:hypothetical protein DPMN_117428, partial [Dreissena polymorpha]